MPKASRQKSLVGPASIVKDDSAVELQLIGKSKAARRKARHDAWMAKVSASAGKGMKTNAPTSKQEWHTWAESLESSLPLPVTKEMMPLTLDAAVLNSDSKKDVNKDPKHWQRAPKRREARHQQALRDMAHFNKVVAHPAFKANPLGALQAHLRNVLKVPTLQPTEN